MYDYVFQHTDSLRAFIRFLESKSISHESRDDVLGRIVAIPEDTDDGILDEVEACYSALQRDEESLLSAQDDKAAGKTSTALTVQLAGGQTVYASIPAEMMRRLLAVLSPEEIGQLVDAIVSAVENPDSRPICQR